MGDRSDGDARVGLVPDRPGFQDYQERIAARPATARAKAKDAELAAAQARA
jgi:hypothetical protein